MTQTMTQAKETSPVLLFFRRLFRRRLVLAAAVLLAIIAALALLAPLLAPYDPAAIKVLRRLKPPSAENWFGTDELGRDIFSRAVYGARASLGIGAAVVVVAMGLGTLLGLLAGYFRRLDAPIRYEPHESDEHVDRQSDPGAEERERDRDEADQGRATQVEPHRKQAAALRERNPRGVIFTGGPASVPPSTLNMCLSVVPSPISTPSTVAAPAMAASAFSPVSANSTTDTPPAIADRPHPFRPLSSVTRESPSRSVNRASRARAAATL